MKYTKSLSKLSDLTDVKIAATISDMEKVSKKINELQELKREIEEEHDAGKQALIRLIYQPVGKKADYYRTRSEIAALNSQLLYLETRIASIAEDIAELDVQISNFNDQLVGHRRKKKKYDKLLTEGL